MIYLKTGKVQVLPHEKAKPWAEKLKEGFKDDFQAVCNYIYFAYGRESHISTMLVQDRKTYAFLNLSGFKKYDTFVEVEREPSFIKCIEEYDKTMRTKTEQRIVLIENKVDSLLEEVLETSDTDKITKLLKTIELLEKQVAGLKKIAISEDSQNIRPVGITLFEIPDEHVKLL